MTFAIVGELAVLYDQLERAKTEQEKEEIQKKIDEFIAAERAKCPFFS